MARSVLNVFGSDRDLCIPIDQSGNSSCFYEKNSFSENDLLNCANGLLFSEENAQLPSPPLLMLDRVIDIQTTGGSHNRGYAKAEYDVTPDSWFFKHHFPGDPVMPGCLLIESLWQLTGFHLSWLQYAGKARVLDSGKT